MRPALQRSNSYGGYRYTPVDTSVAEDSEGERTEGSTDRSTGSRPTTRRSVSHSGMASDDYNLAPTDDIDDKQEAISGTSPSRNTGFFRQSSNYVRIVVVLFFIVSLALHIYTWNIYFTESDFKSPSSQPAMNSPDLFKGAEEVACLLTIDYTKFRREVINTSLNCTPRPSTEIGHNEKPQKLDENKYMYIPLECLCTKQLPHEHYGKTCNMCCPGNNCLVKPGFKPSCQHHGEFKSFEFYNSMLLFEDKCGKCNCSEGFTGNFCQLPKKLKCVKCNTEDCLDLPFCNGTSTYPCQDLYDTMVMNCTKKDDTDNVQDCPPLNSMSTHKYTEKPTKTVETYTLKPHVKGSDKYSVSNTTEEIPATCSRKSTIGYFVLDWIVFVGIIVQFVFLFVRCKVVQQAIEKSKIFKFITCCGLILIVIPPIVNCVTCCSSTCDTVAKLLPFIKCACLVITTVLLYKELSPQKDNHAAK